MPKADIDPLALALLPPKDESPTQKAARLAAEQEATRINNLIDSQLRAERTQIKKESQNQHKILLLGTCSNATKCQVIADILLCCRSSRGRQIHRPQAVPARLHPEPVSCPAATLEGPRSAQSRSLHSRHLRGAHRRPERV